MGFCFNPGSAFVVLGCGNRKEMNATLAAMVNEISEKMKQQKEEKNAHCAENDGLRQQIEVMLISFVCR